MKISYDEAVSGVRLTDMEIMRTVDHATDFQKCMIVSAVTNYLCNAGGINDVHPPMVRRAYAIAFALCGIDIVSSPVES